MYVRDDQLTALRKLYRRTILADAGASLSTVVLLILLFATGIASSTPAGLAITATLAAVLAIAELSVTCSRDVVGQVYTIEYDPLEPSVVRGGWQDES